MTMKTRKYLTTIVAAVAGGMVAFAATDTLTVRIKAMRCEDCAHKVSRVLNDREGVEGLDFNLERRTVTVEYDADKTCADSICNALMATRRYVPTPYSKDEVIRRGIGLKLEEMRTEEDAERVMKDLGTEVGIDSLAPHVDKRYVFVRYDANRTTKAAVKEKLADMGFTPVSYYTSDIISHAYFRIPTEAANEETIEKAITLEGVDDANVNRKTGALAITYVNSRTTEQELKKALKEEGVEVY